MIAVRNLAVQLGRALFQSQALKTNERAIGLLVKRSDLFNNLTTAFHSLSPAPFTAQVGLINFLKPQTSLMVPSCGFKLKAKLHRRCKDCYLVVRDGRAFILCPTHPRHKQMSLVKHRKKTWILTHATQGKERPW